MSAPPLWPPDLPLRAAIRGAASQRQRERISFRAEEESTPIERALTTAKVELFQLSLPPLREEVLESFDQFYDVTLGHGVTPFAWIHPRSRAIRKVRIDASPSETHVSTNRWRVSFTLRVTDVTPAWAGYLTTANGYMQVVDQTAWDAL